MLAVLPQMPYTIGHNTDVRFATIVDANTVHRSGFPSEMIHFTVALMVILVHNESACTWNSGRRSTLPSIASLSMNISIFSTPNYSWCFIFGALNRQIKPLYDIYTFEWLELSNDKVTVHNAAQFWMEIHSDFVVNLTTLVLMKQPYRSSIPERPEICSPTSVNPKIEDPSEAEMMDHKMRRKIGNEKVSPFYNRFSFICRDSWICLTYIWVFCCLFNWWKWNKERIQDPRSM